jgi:hypothetical protein
MRGIVQAKTPRAYTCRPWRSGAHAGASLTVDGIRLLVIAALIAIVASLGTALFHLSSGRGDSGKLVRALATRVALSIVLFILLILAWRSGLITPHGIQR